MHSEKSTQLYAKIGKEAKMPTSPRLPSRTPGTLIPNNPSDRITQVQKQQLASWSEERDSLLKEIAILSDSHAQITEKNKAVAIAATDLHDRKMQLQGSIDAMEKTEESRALLTSQEIAKLLVTKGQLERAVGLLEKDVAVLTDKKVSLAVDITASIALHDRVFARASVLDKVVDRVTRVNEVSILDMDLAIKNLNTAVKTSTESLQNLTSTSLKHLENLEGITARTVKNSSDIAGNISSLSQSVVGKGLGKKL